MYPLPNFPVRKQSNKSCVCIRNQNVHMSLYVFISDIKNLFVDQIFWSYGRLVLFLMNKDGVYLIKAF